MKNGLKLNIGDMTSEEPGAFKVGDVLKGEGLTDAPVGSGERILRYWPAMETKGVFVDRVQEISVTESMRRRDEVVGETEGMVNADEEDGAIVLVDFDGWHFGGLREMRLGEHDDGDDDYDDYDDDDEDVSSLTNSLANQDIADEGCEQDPERMGKEVEGKGKEPERSGEGDEGEGDGDGRDEMETGWFRKEQAMWVHMFTLMRDYLPPFSFSTLPFFLWLLLRARHLMHPPPSGPSLVGVLAGILKLRMSC